MLDALLLLTLAAAPGAASRPAVSAPAPAAQDDPAEKPDKRPEVVALLDELKAHAKERGKEDQDAIGAVDKLLQEFPNCGPKDRKAIVKGLSDCFKEKRQEVDGKMQNELYLACAEALGQMGPESVEALTDWIDHKTLRKDLTLQASLIRSLGRTKDPEAIPTLTDLLSHKDASNQSAAAEGLGNFDGQPSDVRKDIFEAVMNCVTAAKNRMDANLEDLEARDRYNAIKASMITTLQVLSKHDERDPDEWRTWWNKNKKRNWDEGN